MYNFFLITQDISITNITIIMTKKKNLYPFNLSEHNAIITQ